MIHKYFSIIHKYFSIIHKYFSLQPSGGGAAVRLHGGDAELLRLQPAPGESGHRGGGHEDTDGDRGRGGGQVMVPPSTHCDESFPGTDIIQT